MNPAQRNHPANMALLRRKKKKTIRLPQKQIIKIPVSKKNKRNFDSDFTACPGLFAEKLDVFRAWENAGKNAEFFQVKRSDHSGVTVAPDEETSRTT